MAYQFFGKSCHSLSSSLFSRPRAILYLFAAVLEELWIFGDEYALGSDDVSLKQVLRDHLKIVGGSHQDVSEAELTELADIPDLCLWRQYLRGQGDEYEHLVVELKRPTVNISLEEIARVKKYANKILANRHFDKQKTRWKFVVLSDGISADAKEEVAQRDRRHGHVGSGAHHDIWVWTWSEVIQDAKLRLEWVRDRLNVTVSDNSEGMRYLRDKFSHLLPSKMAQAEATTMT